MCESSPPWVPLRLLFRAGERCTKGEDLQGMSNTVQIRPGVGLLSLFPAMNYKPWFAFGEFVDNSIQSYVEHREELRALHGTNYKLKIEISFSTGDVPEILVEDNAAGIFGKDIERAFTPAARPPDRTGISQFGIGMKSAATWYSEYYTVSSSALGEKVTRVVTFDIKKIVDQNIEELPIESSPKDPDHHGTRILMRNLHQGLPHGQTLGKIRAFIGSIYRDYIRGGDVLIYVGGELLSFDGSTVLNQTYWPTDKGPGADALPKRWSLPIDFTLDGSWEEDKSPERPSKPPRVRGWMAILATGSTRKSGAALLWKKKVVVGAGSMAQGDEDSYRPGVVFGSTNSFPFQRLFGELDLSEFQVTAFKDQIDWRPGQELEFQEKLLEALNAGPEPMLRMARNYRSTLKTPDTGSAVRNSVQGTTLAAQEAFESVLSAHISGIPDEVIDTPSDVSDVEAQAAIFSVDGQGLRMDIIVDRGEKQWLKVSQDQNTWVVQLNRAHPFMNSFANLPGADLDPVFRIGMAIALAEIRARNASVPYPTTIRGWVNDSLGGELASRMGPSSRNE